MLEHMAPSLVEPSSWERCGQALQALLLDGLDPARTPEVQSAALGALAALLRTCAAFVREADERVLGAADDKVPKQHKAKNVHKQHKATAASLGEALPAVIGVMGRALNVGGAGSTADGRAKKMRHGRSILL